MKRTLIASIGFLIALFFLLPVVGIKAQYVSPYNSSGNVKPYNEFKSEMAKQPKWDEKKYQQDVKEKNARNTDYDRKTTNTTTTTTTPTNYNRSTTSVNTSHTTSARVYFSTEVPVGGNAKEGKEFNITSDGGYVYLVVNNSPDNFNYDELKLKVKKTIGGTDEVFDNKTYTISSNVFSTYIKYSFYSAGYYTFDVFSKYGNLVGSAGVTITMKSSSTSSSSSSSDDCIASSYKQYMNSTLGFSMCIPKDSYAEAEGDDITVKEFYGKKLSISFMNEPENGIDAFDASVIDMTKGILKTTFTSYYRKEFKLLSTYGSNTIYRSVLSATSNSGVVLQRSSFYVKMNGNKIKGKDFMTVSGPFVSSSSDETYQIIIELGMLKHLKIF